MHVSSHGLWVFLDAQDRELFLPFREFPWFADASIRELSAIEVEPTNPRALTALGKLNEKEGNYAQALANYQRSLWHDAMQPEVQQRIAALQSTRPTTPLVTSPAPTRTVTTAPPITR